QEVNKPGKCPAEPTIARKAHFCRSDKDCDGSGKCCVTKVGKECVKPVQKQEYQILKERETLNVKERVADDTPAGHRSGGLNMLVISRDGMRKNVFGAGYPSVPSQSIDDWLKRRGLKEKRAETEFAERSVVESFKPGADKKTVTFAEEPKSNSNSDSDDESRLASKREWDEYKDTHPRGWGNTTKVDGLNNFDSASCSLAFISTFTCLYIFVAFRHFVEKSRFDFAIDKFSTLRGLLRLMPKAYEKESSSVRQ
ncbi:WAP-type 'four-disulfide core, partial [Trichuris suis]